MGTYRVCVGGGGGLRAVVTSKRGLPRTQLLIPDSPRVALGPYGVGLEVSVKQTDHRRGGGINFSVIPLAEYSAETVEKGPHSVSKAVVKLTVPKGRRT